MSDVEPLAPASNLYDLRDRIQEVRQRLNGMTPDWWVRERMPPDDPSAAVVHDPEDSAARCRLEAAKEYRDVLRLQCMRLWKPGLPNPPPQHADPERDMFEVLLGWVMDSLSAQCVDQPTTGNDESTPDGMIANLPPRVVKSQALSSLDPVGEDASSNNDPRNLHPSRLKAKAVYEWAWNEIEGAENMTIADLYYAARGRLDAATAKAHGAEAERLGELSNSLPSKAATFAKYLRDAGIKRYGSTGDRLPGRSVRRAEHI